MITLALMGDVMLGRRVAEALSYRMHPEEPWGDVMPLLNDSDLRIINLEYAITDNKRPWTCTPKVFHFRTPFSAVEALRTARIDACSLANNHTLDFEEQGLLDTLKHLDAAGILHAGAGHNREEAPVPAILTVSADRYGVALPASLRPADLRELERAVSAAHVMGRIGSYSPTIGARTCCSGQKVSSAGLPVPLSI